MANSVESTPISINQQGKISLPRQPELQYHAGKEQPAKGAARARSSALFRFT